MNSCISMKSGTYKRVSLPNKMLFPHGYYALYVSKETLFCIECEKEIPPINLFRCGTKDNKQVRRTNLLYPFCRFCLPFNLYTSEERKELLEEEEELPRLQQQAYFPVFEK